MTLISFIITLAVTSTAISLLVLASASLLPRARYWPLFWSVGLIASVASAVLAAAFSQFTALMPQINITPLPLIENFTASPWPALMETDIEQANSVSWVPALSQALVLIYVAGVLINLLKLGIGRYRAGKIAKTSSQIELVKDTMIGLTPMPPPCMTVTPLGRPAQSRIILSEAFYKSLTEMELQTVIAHEQGHIARRDDEFGLILRILLTLAWFNPLTHILFDRWTLSAELQCDRIAIQDHSHPMRRAYAQTLLKALHISADRVRQYPAASLSTQHLRNEKMRINRIMSGPAPTFKHVGHKLGLLATATSITLASAILISAPTQANPAPAPNVAAAPTSTAEAEPSSTPQTIKRTITFKINGELTSSYGKAKDPFNKNAVRNHHGVDFKAALGTPLYAPSNGVIIEATDVFDGKPAYGKVVIIQTEGGTQTMMAHLNSYAVQKGQQVLKGQEIAEIGSTGKSTGPHVHIETRQNGVRVDPMSVWQFEK